MTAAGAVPPPPEVADLDEDVRQLEEQLVEIAFRRRWTIAAIVAIIVVNAIVGLFAIFQGVDGGPGAFILVTLIFGGAGTFSLSLYLLELRTTARELGGSLERLAIERREILAGRVKRNATPYARYKEHVPLLAQSFRIRAGRYRRIYSTLQLVVIVGSFSATAVTAALSANDRGRFAGIALTLAVSIAASINLTFRPKERADSLHSTADDIDREYRAAELNIGHYAEIGNDLVKLRSLVERVEDLRSKQALTERRLDQSPDLQQPLQSDVVKSG